jgi:hypothetical protein
MTAAALSQSPKPYEVPEGGLASFLTATVGDWSDEALNSDNYYDIVKPTAEQLAAFGREEDDRIAHVATGETVIPMAVFEEDPALKEALFARMRDMGIEPERYVVGNELNSINPVTGQPEFFLKKLFKGIKKAVKGVVKVFKKIAPIVLSIGLSMTPLGPIVGAALGSGIGTLIQGGSLKDAFKAAAIGGAVAGIGSGISNVVKAQVPGGSAGGTFMEGVRGALPDIDKIQSTFSGAGGATVPAVGPDVAAVDPNFGAGPAPAGYDPAGMLASTDPAQVALGGQKGVEAAAQANVAKPLEEVLVTAKRITPQTSGVPEFFTPTVASAVNTLADEKALRLPREETPVTERAKRAYDKISDYAVRGGKTPGEIELQKALKGKQAYENVINKFIESVPEGTPIPENVISRAYDAMEAAEAAAGPGFFAKYGPLTAASLGILGLAGGFEQPEMEEIEGMYGGLTGMDLIRQNPGKYSVGVPFQYPPPGAANGGDIQHFPRKNGPIYGPGTETSDDIPAMLSDGEFVMTAKAVRGAGNGSREVGMRRMYDMMRKFEGGAARGY